LRLGYTEFLCTEATSWPILPFQKIDDGMEHKWNDNWQESHKVLGQKFAPEPFCPLQFPRGRSWCWGRVSTLRSRRLIPPHNPRAMARPSQLFPRGWNLDMVINIQIVKKFCAFNGTRRFFTLLTIVRHLSYFRATWIQFSLPCCVFKIQYDVSSSIFHVTSFLHIFRSRLCVHFSSFSHVFHPLCILSSFSPSPSYYLTKSTYYEAPHYADPVYFLLLSS
jgi:hypothetical protein